MEENLSTVQNVIIENRKRFNISGVKDVTSFDDESILLDTLLGKMTIKGEKMQIERFDTESGELTATGRLHAVIYISDSRDSVGFFSKMFR